MFLQQLFESDDLKCTKDDPCGYCKKCKERGTLKVKDKVNEDDFYPAAEEYEDTLTPFVEQWVDNTYGIPPASYTVNGYKDIRVSLPRDRGPRITHDSVKSGEMKFELRRDAHDLIEELRASEFGEYEVGTLSAFHFELQKQELMASRGQLPKAQQRIRKHKLR